MATILGLNAFHAGSSACLVVDGKVVFAIAEERINRVKYYAGFPKLAMAACLDFAGLMWKDVDHVAVGRDPKANRTQKVGFALRRLDKTANLLAVRAKSRRFSDIKALIAAEVGTDPRDLRFQVHNVEHHVAHNASSYFISPFESAAGMSIDGSGDFVTTMFTRCEGERITVLNKTFVPHSLGSFYTMICQLIGYGKYGDEGKVMGLAPYGEDRYSELFADIVRLTPTGFAINNRFFMPFGSDHGLETGEDGVMKMRRHYSEEMVQLVGPPRADNADYSQRDKDLAFGVQKRFEEVYMHLLNLLHKKCPTNRLVLSGGCALNSVANGKLFDATPFVETCIQPAASDDGLAMGAALYVSNCVLKEGKRQVLLNASLGDEFSDSAIKGELDAAKIEYRSLASDALIEATADHIVKGDVVGWFQGRMEWGPRALGNRSILVHPGFPNMKDILNARIKRREWFRPFAPVVLEERQGEIFDKTHPSPFMMHVYKIKAEWRDRLSAVNHADDTGRLQTVSREENAMYYDLIDAFNRRTGIPVLLNTSFNENEPIVRTPQEAIDCFLRTKMDVLAIGSFLCVKDQRQDALT